MKGFKLLGILIFLLILGCQKENLEDEREKRAQIADVSSTKVQQGNLSLEDVKAFFYTTQRDCSREEIVHGGFEPIWMLSKKVITAEGGEIMIVPLPIHEKDVKDGRGLQLVFYPNQNSEMIFEVVMYEADNYDESRPYPLKNHTFTGIVSTYNYFENHSYLYQLEEGEITALIERDLPSFSDNRTMYWPKWLCDLLGIVCCPSPSGGDSNKPKKSRFPPRMEFSAWRWKLVI